MITFVNQTIRTPRWNQFVIAVVAQLTWIFHSTERCFDQVDRSRSPIRLNRSLDNANETQNNPNLDSSADINNSQEDVAQSDIRNFITLYELRIGEDSKMQQKAIELVKKYSEKVGNHEKDNKKWKDEEKKHKDEIARLQEMIQNVMKCSECEDNFDGSYGLRCEKCALQR